MIERSNKEERRRGKMLCARITFSQTLILAIWLRQFDIYHYPSQDQCDIIICCC